MIIIAIVIIFIPGICVLIVEWMFEKPRKIRSAINTVSIPKQIIKEEHQEDTEYYLRRELIRLQEENARLATENAKREYR